MYGIDDGVELLEIKFTSPFEITDGCDLLSEHTFGHEMEFRCGGSDTIEGSVQVLATIGSINTDVSDADYGSQSVEGENILQKWKSQHTEEVTNQRKSQVWDHMTLEKDNQNTKLFNIELHDDDGLIMLVEVFRYGKLHGSMLLEEGPSLYTTQWVESENLKGGDIDHNSSSTAEDLSADVCIFNVPGCVMLDTSVVQEDMLQDLLQGKL